MRNFAFILLLCIFLTSTVFGGEYSVDKGSTMISGTFSFTNSSGKLYEDFEGNSATSFTLGPSVLAFLVPNFALGGTFAFTHISQGDASATALAIGPKLAYFVGGPDSNAYPFFGVGFAYLRQTFDFGKSEYTISGTKFYFGAGVSVMIASHLALICEGAYNIDNLKPEGGKSASGNIFAINVGLAGFIF